MNVDEDGFRDIVNKLKSIEFQEIKNDLQLANGALQIPHMEIKNSAMDIKVEGIQKVDGWMNYSFQFNIKDISRHKKLI